MRYLSNWRDLAFFYYSLDCHEEAINCFDTVLEISPTISKTLESIMRSAKLSDSFIDDFFKETK